MRVGETLPASVWQGEVPGDGGHQGLCRLALEGCSAVRIVNHSAFLSFKAP